MLEGSTAPSVPAAAEMLDMTEPSLIEIMPPLFAVKLMPSQQNRHDKIGANFVHGPGDLAGVHPISPDRWRV